MHLLGVSLAFVREIMTMRAVLSVVLRQNRQRWQKRDNAGRRCAGGTHRRKAVRGIAFGKPDSSLVADQLVVAIGRHRQIEKCLQKPVKMGGWREVFPSSDQINLIFGIIHHHGKVIGYGDIGAGDDNITKYLWRRRLPASDMVKPAKIITRLGSGKALCGLHAKTPGRALTGLFAAGDLSRVKDAIGIVYPIG